MITDRGGLRFDRGFVEPADHQQREHQTDAIFMEPARVNELKEFYSQALQRKLVQLHCLQPDLAVIPEMAAPGKLGEDFVRSCGYNLEWAGRAGTKGLGVMINPAWTYRIADDYRSEFELFLPIAIEAPVRFNLLAVWAFNHRAKAIYMES